MNNKIWVVTYQDYNMDEPPYNLGEPVITCFNNKENASRCYHEFYLRHDNVLIDECEVYTEFKVY